MAAPKRYPDELRERATRLAVEARQDPAWRAGALQRIGERLGRAARDQPGDVAGRGEAGRDRRRAGARDDDRGGAADQGAWAEVRQLRRADEILKSASAFSPWRSSTAS